MMGDATSRTGRTLAWVGVVLGLAGLILQFSLSIPAVMSQGRTFLSSIELYFSYFTILSNSALVLVYYAVARGTAAGAMAVLRGPTVRAGMAAVMLFVCGFFHIVLAPTLNPQGWWMVADVTLHYAAPLFYALYWLVFASHGHAQFRAIPLIVAWPLAYALYAVVRGAIIGAYPYPVLNALALGYGRVAANIVGLLLVFVLLCAAVIALDRFLGRTKAVVRPS